MDDSTKAEGYPGQELGTGSVSGVQCLEDADHLLVSFCRVSHLPVGGLAGGAVESRRIHRTLGQHARMPMAAPTLLSTIHFYNS